VESHLSATTEQKQDKENKVKELQTYQGKFQSDIRKLVKDVKFFESNDICPSCSQPITEETKQEHILEGKERAKQLQEATGGT
jgi:DNA repair exonuclease SbcCD ATPase subunit